MEKIKNFADDLVITPEGQATLKKQSVIKKKTPISPGEWTSEPEYKKVTCIRMSCGEGMGYEYVERIHDYSMLDRKFLRVKRIDGKEITLNTNNIVSVEDFTLVSARYHRINPHFSFNDYIAMGLIEDYQTVELIDERSLFE